MSSSTTWPPTTRVIGVVDVERLPGKASAKLRCRLHFLCSTSNRHLNRTSASLTTRRFLTCCSRSSIRASSHVDVFWLWDIVSAVRYCEHFELVWDVPICIRGGNFHAFARANWIASWEWTSAAGKEYSTDVPWLVGPQSDDVKDFWYPIMLLTWIKSPPQRSETKCIRGILTPSMPSTSKSIPLPLPNQLWANPKQFASDIAPQCLSQLCKSKLDKVCLYEMHLSNIRTSVVRCATVAIAMRNGLTCAQGTFIAFLPFYLYILTPWTSDWRTVSQTVHRKTCLNWKSITYGFFRWCFINIFCYYIMTAHKPAKKLQT